MSEVDKENRVMMDIDKDDDAKKPSARNDNNKDKIMDQQLPWVEKYRPQRLEDLVAHEDIISIITNLIDNNNLPHLLFYGPPGTGKTSTIVAAAKRMYNNNPSTYNSMTLELNASDARGIDVVRNEIKEFAGTKQLNFFGNSGNDGKSSSIKLIILDEADAMTSDAQFALRRIIEKYTKHVRFCMICNYVSKIIPALQSRCTKFRFAPLKQEQIYDRLLHVIRSEPALRRQPQPQTTTMTDDDNDDDNKNKDHKVTDDGIQAILSLSNGDMRRVLNLLQATTMSLLSTSSSSDTTTKMVDEEAVYLTSGSPLPKDMDQILYVLLNDNFKDAYEYIVRTATTKGYALVDIVQEITHKIMTTMAPSFSSSLGLAKLLDGLSNIEHRLSFGTNEKIQIASLVGVFIETRSLLQVKR